MRRRHGPAGEERRKIRWWMPMAGAFAAGFIAVGIAILVPGQGKEQGPASPFAPPAPPAAAAQVSPPAPVSIPALPRIAIVVDDLGYEPSRDAEWLKFPEKVTVAVIPFGPSSRKVAESAHAKGWGVILHVPMEPETPTSDRTERFRILKGMPGEEMDALLSRMAENIPQAKGASNHMGSAVTADAESMKSYVFSLKKRGMFLLDSVTTPRSQAVEVAERMNIPAARRDVYLDDDMNPDEMRRQWDRAISIAREKGTAILVCHGRAETLKALLALLPELRQEKIRAVTLEEILGGKEA